MNKMLPADQAVALYNKLSPFLRVEKGDDPPKVEPWGCYPPLRFGRHSLADWPLSSWAGPGTSPLCLSWTPNSDRRPTFSQFCRVYGVEVRDAG